MARRCEGTNKANGKPCGKWAEPGGDFCRWHRAPVEEAPVAEEDVLTLTIDAAELAGGPGWIEGSEGWGLTPSGDYREMEQMLRRDLLDQGMDAEQLETIPEGAIYTSFLRYLVERACDGKPVPKKFSVKPVPFAPDQADVPSALPQPTFQEARAVGQAYADGPLGLRWVNSEGEEAMIHAVEGEMLQVKLTAGPYLQWLGLPTNCESLRRELREAGIPAVLLSCVLLGMVLQSPRGRTTADIDDLIRAIGWKPRTTIERAKMRQQVWRWLLMFDATWVIGLRGGRKWKDRLTGKEIDLTSNDPLLRVVGTRPAAQTAIDNSEPPLTVSWVGGDWLERMRGNRRILSDFGDVMRIAQIPAGKPSGAWAQSIGLALQQRWRERAPEARVAYAGEDNRPTPQFSKPFTRRDLLTLFRCDPDVEAVLASNDPARARRNWDEAIRLLKAAGVIGYYKELEPLAETRKGWGKGWLDQPLDIRPKLLEDRKAIAELSRAATNARKGRARRKAASA